MHLNSICNSFKKLPTLISIIPCNIKIIQFVCQKNEQTPHFILRDGQINLLWHAKKMHEIIQMSRPDSTYMHADDVKLCYFQLVFLLFFARWHAEPFNTLSRTASSTLSTLYWFCFVLNINFKNILYHVKFNDYVWIIDGLPRRL